MKLKVFKEFKFSAAHYLDIEGHKCSQLHGHNYKLRIEVTGKPDKNGMIIDFKEIKKHVKPLLKIVDHSNLNETLGFLSTTCEDLCMWFYGELYKKIPKITKIEIQETDTCGAMLEIEKSDPFFTYKIPN